MILSFVGVLAFSRFFAYGIGAEAPVTRSTGASRSSNACSVMKDAISEPIPAKIRREVPGASLQLPTAALGTAGGGSIPVDPRDKQGVAALRHVFQLDLSVPAGERHEHLGTRVFVRFDHGFEPAGFQLYRALRRLLLRQFNV